MIDSIILNSNVHIWTGTFVLVSVLFATIISLFYAIKKKAHDRLFHFALILAQISIVIQVLVGIKLLDQGLGVLQLYIHYIGGIGAIFFLILYYWLPEKIRTGRWLGFSLIMMSFLFALQTFVIGSIYVA